MSHWHTIEFPQYAFLIKFFIWRFFQNFFSCVFFSLAFRDFLWWFFSWIFSLAMIWYTFLIAHNCNYLRLCYCSFICEAHAHESTTQVSPPLQFSFSSLKASLFTYISAASSLKFPWSIFLGNMSSWARYATATVCLCQPACLPVSVCLSVSLSIEDRNMGDVLWGKGLKMPTTLSYIQITASLWIKAVWKRKRRWSHSVQFMNISNAFFNFAERKVFDKCDVINIKELWVSTFKALIFA